MDNSKIYDELYGQAYNYVKGLRDPHAIDSNYLITGFANVEEDDIFYSSFDDFYRNVDILYRSKRIYIKYLLEIIIRIGSLYSCDFILQHSNPKYKQILQKESSTCFTIYDKKNDRIIFFKDKEHDLSANLGSNEVIDEYKNHFNIKNHIIVYLLYSKTNNQFVTGNDNDGKIFNITDFFEMYFGEAERELFIKKTKEYNDKKNDYLGLYVLKTLSAKSSLNYRRIFEKRLVSFNYEILLKKEYRCKENSQMLKKSDFSKIYKQFIDDKLYKLLFYNYDIAESLITSEWLYDTLKNAQAIDLTPIAVGFLKAIEQVIFTMVCLYKDKKDCEGRIYEIKKNKDKIWIALTKENIENNSVDTSMGALHAFYNRYKGHILRKEIYSKKYVRNAIFNYKEIRNGYLHKHNITNWDIINMIKEEAYSLLFLVIGSQKISEKDLIKLKLDKMKSMTDFDLLCEFLDYHVYSGNIFLLKNTDNIGFIAAPIKNIESNIYDNNFIEYTKLSFKLFNLEKGCFDNKIISYNKTNLPKEISMGRIDFRIQDKRIKLGFKLEDTIYKDGKMKVSLIDYIKDTHY